MSGDSGFVVECTHARAFQRFRRFVFVFCGLRWGLVVTIANPAQILLQFHDQTPNRLEQASLGVGITKKN